MALRLGTGTAHTARCAVQLRPKSALESEQCPLQTASVSLFEFGLELKPVVRDGKRKTAVLPVPLSVLFSSEHESFSNLTEFTCLLSEGSPHH